MFRMLVFLIGTALLGAVMAGVYYAPQNLELREEATAYNPGPGEVRQDTVHPSLPGSDIVYTVEVLQGVVDVYVMEQPWASTLSRGGSIGLDRPFSYLHSLSATHVNGTYTFTIRSDGETSYVVLFDNSDNFYEGDAGEDDNGTTAEIRATARFIEEEERSLLWGYIATVPSFLLVAVTFGRQFQRGRRHRAEQAADARVEQGRAQTAQAGAGASAGRAEKAPSGPSGAGRGEGPGQD